jgi:carbohydrate kinase (thermoresistant glucokinase family)
MASMSSSHPAALPSIPIVIMGVSASGKSTVGRALGRAMGRDFVDGDDLHPASNREKMRRGEPLDDADRAPWLDALAGVLADDRSHPSGLVIACSALKRVHRDALRSVRRVQFVFLDAGRRLIERRFDSRTGHFMPRALIASQFEALQRPDASESDVLTIDAALPVEDAVRAVIDFLAARGSAAREDAILRSWQSNAVPWTRAIREERIASRTLVTNAGIVDALRALSVRRILDLGCGEGWLARALSAEGVAVTGVDAVDSLIAEARRLGGGSFAVRSYADLAEGRFDGRGFDAAVCNFSLLGDESAETLCRSLHRYLSPSGHLVIQTLHPVTSCGPQPYTDGWRPGSWEGFGAGFHDPAPWYFRTLSSWLSLIERCGYRLIACREPTARDAPLPSSIIFVGRA